ncbi:hypothetical protein MKZ17_16165 [Solibacillus sp. FSL R7-0682]|uniref:hypothetical protein n=1 Tax=Solibacillus sp. FSL R7-0682 TaxID=2921690 RepID=UPI0030FBAEDD
MNTLFLLLLLASMVALFALIPMVIINIVRKRKSQTLYRNTGIAIVVTFISIVGFTITIEETEVADEPLEVKANEEIAPTKKVEIDMNYANDTTIPLGDRIKKIATDLYSDKTIQDSDRNIAVESMGDLYYLNLMIDDGVTMKNTLSLAQKNTVDLLKVLQNVEDFQQININWQGNFKDSSGNSNVGSAMTVMIKKEGIANVDFEGFNAKKLKDISVNYGTHNSFK